MTIQKLAVKNALGFEYFLSVVDSVRLNHCHWINTGSDRSNDGLTWISLAPTERNRSAVSLWKFSRISCVTWDGSVSAASSSLLALEDARSMANCELK